MPNSRYWEKNLRKGERTPWNFLKSEGRFNSDFPNAEATVLFSFCITAMSPPELLPSTPTMQTLRPKCPLPITCSTVWFSLIWGNTSQPHRCPSELGGQKERVTSHLTLPCQFRCFTFTKSRIEANKNQKFLCLYETPMRTTQGL